MRIAIAVLLGVAASSLGYVLLRPDIPSGSDYLLVFQGAVPRIALLFLAACLGSYAHAVQLRLADADELVHVRTVLSSAARSKSFLNALVVSPIVFFTVYNLAGKLPDDIVAVCMAFQNGFFWKVVLERSRPEARTPEAGNAHA
jgi:hypothetical protein